VCAIRAHRLVGEAPQLDLPMPMLVRAADRDRPLATKQVVVGLGLRVEDVALQVEPEVGVGDRQFADLLALGEDRQPSALMIEVFEPDRLQ
jgi:hypothetical protein